ncbi:PoNi-like cognate immunity protein [Bhargavaea beijingensis]|uniref:PoNi-like cognate immunity protein n=1 Tax=Bhargavaea beijingensis TaxID=426756 RepID=UPI002223F4A6|nr:PoNi-like cognate immunity protein [Bhargavaea beijingensis]MCW1929303.1 PoNi-like cognate immunity protein [Bhargavaea beijingensis]
MVRDLSRSESYYKTYIEKKSVRIKKIEEVLNSVISQRGESDEGARNGFIFLTNHYLDQLIAKYSAGYPLKEIKVHFKDVVNRMEKSWNGENYEQMLWTLSIGVMLDVEDTLFNRLVGLVRSYELQDGLLEFLIQGKLHGSETFEGHLKFKTPYAKLVDVINAENKVENLRKYLEKYWYNGHSDSGWHDTHKHPDPIYSGYWSFESGAVAKILGLDDSSLKDVPYYPYDMVHYKG